MTLNGLYELFHKDWLTFKKQLSTPAVTNDVIWLCACLHHWP